MTYIEDLNSYNKLPHITLIQSDGTFKDLGLYDPDCEVIFENDLGQIYNEIEYKGKKALRVAFKHTPIGNKWFLKKQGLDHFHVKYFVSTNGIPLSDVMITTDKKQIILSADLCRHPVEVIHLPGNQEQLFELIPYLSIKKSSVVGQIENERTESNKELEKESKILKRIKNIKL